MKIIASGWDRVVNGFRGQYSRWGLMSEQGEELASNRIYRDSFRPHVEPKFQLQKNESIFTSGSCFAREIERHLEKIGISVPTKYLNQKKYVKEKRANDGALFNRFNPASIADEIRAICNPAFLGERLIYELSENSAYDAYFSPAQEKCAKSGKLEIRSEILSYQNNFIQNAGAVFLTLGMSEAIYDKEFESYLNGAPVLGKYNVANNSRFEGHLIGLDETLAYLDESRNSLKQHISPNMKMIVTVSPVPLEVTFTGGDVVQANQVSKSTLRLAAEIFCKQYDDVDYWPSFEMVLYAEPATAWKNDFRHVEREKVSQIMNYFVEKYYGTQQTL